MKVTEILQLLSDNTRLRILRLLAKEELSVAELQEILEKANQEFFASFFIEKKWFGCGSKGWKKLFMF